jgi:hypothetical protein
MFRRVVYHGYDLRDVAGGVGLQFHPNRAKSWTEFAPILEKCRVDSKDRLTSVEYSVDDGVLSGSVPNLPPIPPDRLYLSTAAGFAEFRTPYELLKNLVFSEYSPKGIHLLLLNRFPKGYNFPGVVKTLIEGDPDRRRLVEEYLRLMIPNLLQIGLQAHGDRDWVAFVEKAGNAESTFYVSQVSDGTIYALEFLIDLFVRGLTNENSFPVFIEEPGMSLHPWAAGVVRSAIMEASRKRQVLITTHSPDLLDDPTIDPSMLRVVYRNAEGTHIETLGKGALTVLRDGLATPGELFRRSALGSDDEPEFVSSVS